MSKRLPVLKGEDVVAILKKHGFKIIEHTPHYGLRMQYLPRL